MRQTFDWLRDKVAPLYEAEAVKLFRQVYEHRTAQLHASPYYYFSEEYYAALVDQMQLAVALAGFTMGEADILRKAMGKKKVEVMAAQIAQAPLSVLMGIKAGVKRAWEMMGMRVHLQTSTDYITICSGATDVREYMAQGAGRLPRQFAARPASEDEK